MKIFILPFLCQILLKANGGRLHYFNNDNLEENDKCNHTETTVGHCKKLEDCKEEFEKYKTSSNVLKVCRYGKPLKENLICCPVKSINVRNIEQSNYADYEFCINQFLELRKSVKNTGGIFGIGKKNVTFKDR